MKTNGFYKYYKDLPPMAKTAVTFAVIAGVGVSTYLIYEKVHTSKSEKDAKDGLADAKNDIKKIQQYQRPNYIDSQYETFADSLFEAMTGQGTEEDDVYSVFNKMKNDIDVLKLIDAFGIKDYTDDKLFIWNVKPMNLNQWLAIELEPEEKDKLNTILSTKRIKYRF